MDEKGALGNRVSMMLPELPVGIVDPVERLAAVRAEMERLKQGQASAFESLMSLSRNACGLPPSPAWAAYLAASNT